MVPAIAHRGDAGLEHARIAANLEVKGVGRVLGEFEEREQLRRVLIVERVLVGAESLQAADRADDAACRVGDDHRLAHGRDDS